MRKLKPTTHLGQMIRTYRVLRGWDLRKMASFMGISYPTLMRIEHGRAMDQATWMKIQGYLFTKTFGLSTE